MSPSKLSAKFNNREPVTTPRPLLRILLAADKLPPFIGGTEAPIVPGDKVKLDLQPAANHKRTNGMILRELGREQ
jgi:hypothetical protein